MPDLSVTDVQSVLRTLAERGHDVLQNPHQVHIQKKPYGLVVGHHLQLGSLESNWSLVDSKKPKFLDTYLLQAERPVISRVLSSLYAVPHYVEPQVQELSEEGFSRYFIPQKVQREGVWAAKVTKTHDIHDALKFHTSNEFKYDKLDKSHNFDEKEALKHLVHSIHPFSGLIEPFSGLIGVTARIHETPPKGEDMYGFYSYNPSTEQLSRLK